MHRLIGILSLTLLCGCDDPAPAAGSGSATSAKTSASATKKSATAKQSASAPTTASAATSASASASAEVEAGPPLVFEGLKLSPQAPAKGKPIEVKADGTVVSDGKTLATFKNNELHDEKGDLVYSVAKDGSISGPKINKKAHFNEKDELISDDGDKMTIGNDGAMQFEHGGKTEKSPFKMEGVNDKNKRAAILLVTYLLMQTEGPPTASSASAGPVAAPPSAAPPAVSAKK